jgi:hypothetical protein
LAAGAVVGLLLSAPEAEFSLRLQIFRYRLHGNCNGILRAGPSHPASNAKLEANPVTIHRRFSPVTASSGNKTRDASLSARTIAYDVRHKDA